MNTEKTWAGLIERMQGEFADLLELMIKQAQTGELPEHPTSLEAYQDKLRSQNYQVLVVGEAKRGKSSFINALIGRSILPTDVSVTTCQVFRIRDASTDAYRVRFADGSTKEITADELPLYGSQTVRDRQGLPTLNEIVHWIEVDTPAHFLPKGVCLLDTPGLGSLYAAHAQITQRFVRQADAVIFVLESQPILQEELDFLETLLEVTPNIFFIQTKIDAHTKKTWQGILQRNQEILQKRFGNRLANMTIWPISNHNLLQVPQSTEEDREDFLRVSRYSDLAIALQNFLFSATGKKRFSEIYQVTEAYQQYGLKTVQGYITSLSTEMVQERKALQSHLKDYTKQFSQEWGEQGEQRMKLLMHVRNIASKAQQTFLRAIRQSGPIEDMVRTQIKSLNNLTEIYRYSNQLEGKLIGACLDEWERIYQQMLHDCHPFLLPFVDATPPQLLLTTNRSSRSQTRRKPVVDSEGERIVDSVDSHEQDGIAIAHFAVADRQDEIIKQVRKESEMVGTVIRAVFSGPQYDDERNQTVDQMASLAGLLWAVIRKGALERNLQKQEALTALYARLEEAMFNIRFAIQGDNQVSGVSGQATTYYKQFVENLSARIDQLATQRIEEAQAEITRLETEGALNEQRRIGRIANYQSWLDQWNQHAFTLQKLAQELRQLEQLP